MSYRRVLIPVNLGGLNNGCAIANKDDDDVEINWNLIRTPDKDSVHIHVTGVGKHFVQPSILV